jgi:hypothetical protein
MASGSGSAALSAEVAEGLAAEQAVADADDLVASAAQFRVRAHKEAADADDDVAVLEETLSALSGRSVRSLAPSVGASVNMAQEQTSLEATAKNMGLKTDAIAALIKFPIRYPLIFRALLARGGGRDSPAVLEDFSLLVLLPAVLAAKAQDHGLKMLREAASRSAACAGAPGAQALRALNDATFDLLASDAIDTEAVGMDVSPLDLCLGVLPLTQLGLHFWYKHHSFRPVEASALLAAARAMSFVVAGAVDPGPGLLPFLPLWQTALGTDDDVPHEEIYFSLVEALHRDAHARGAGFVSIEVGGSPVTWDAFALGRVAAWRADSGGLLGAGRRLPSRVDLITLVRQLQRFADACAVTAYAPGSLRPPTLGASARLALIHADPPAPRPRPARRERRAPTRGPPPRQAQVPLGEPVRISTMVVPTAINILATTPLLRAGWRVTLQGGTIGSTISAAGGMPVPLRHDGAGNIFLEVVPEGFGYTPYCAADGAHRLLPRSHFLLDTGAEISVVAPQNIALLREIGTIPIITVTGFSGEPVFPSAAGVFCLYPPRAARGTSALPAGWGGRVCYVAPLWDRPYDTESAMVLALKVHDAAMRRTRASANPPVKQAHILAERYNCINADSLTALLLASPIGVADGILESVVPGTDYSQGYASNIMKAPPIHATRYTLSSAIRDAMPPGHVWWTDVSNMRPPDFQGNTYSRLFAEERTSYAVTTYSSRKDSGTLVSQLEELRAWITQHVPGGNLSVLRCDFASEIVRQGHGDDVNTRALSAYCDQGAS